MIKALLWFFLIILPGALLVFNQSSAKEGNSKKIIIKYKQYESFDLGNLEIKGDIVAPGDLTVGERNRKVFERKLYERTSYDIETKEDINNLR